MMEKRISTACVLSTALLFCMTYNIDAFGERANNDWDTLWQRNVPEPEIVEVAQLKGLGEDLENQKWHRVSTRYHQIHYQPSLEKNTLSEVHLLIDNIYTFLEGRSPAKPEIPIRVFLVPNQKGRSRCSMAANAMRTDAQADPVFILTSLLHEETHLFNFAFLNDARQGWWMGEFFCIYYQQQALWQTQDKNVKREIASALPNGPRCHLSNIDERGKQAFDEAISALYFFEQQYGRESLNRLRQACLEQSKRTNGGPLPDSIFAQVFGQDINQLHRQWLQFYGRWSTREPAPPKAHDHRLNVRISYVVDKASVQNVVMAMAQQAGLQYDWEKSRTNTDPMCRRWIRNLRINRQPLHRALTQVLDPHGLTYKLERDAIVLYKK